MSRRSDRRKLKRQHVPKPKPPRKTTDRAIYLGFAIVGFFIVVLAWLFTADSEIEYWRHVLLGYIIAFLYLTSLYTAQVYRGKHLENWKQALARIPLRFAGYGTKEGKPLDAAHGHSQAKLALMVCIAVSALIIAGAALLLIPGAAG